MKLTNIKRKIRTDVAKHRADAIQTGGGPPPRCSSPIYESNNKPQEEDDKENYENKGDDNGNQNDGDENGAREINNLEAPISNSSLSVLSTQAVASTSNGLHWAKNNPNMHPKMTKRASQFLFAK